MTSITVVTTIDAIAEAFLEWDRCFAANPEAFTTTNEDSTGMTRAFYLVEKMKRNTLCPHRT